MQLKNARIFPSKPSLPLTAALLLLTSGITLSAQQSSSSASNPYLGSVQTTPVTAEAIDLTLDDAINLGLKSNLSLQLGDADVTNANGERLQALQGLFPDITVTGGTGFHEYNLQAQGFTHGTLNKFSQALPASELAGFPIITKVTLTQGQINLKQNLFNMPAIDLYKALDDNLAAAKLNVESSRQTVVLQAGTAYLQAVAAQAEVENAKELLAADDVLLKQAVAQHEAGVTANLDELRARVQYQTQQSALITAETNLSKAKISLNRIIGLAAEQKINLVDEAPYTQLAAITSDEARSKAYEARQDYQSLKAQIRVAQRGLKAVKHERLPTVSLQGDYGVTGTNGGVYHGLFTVYGTVSVPIFREARFRGDAKVSQAQLMDLIEQLGDLRGKIDQQVRDSLLDIAATNDLVRVAQSNVEVATRLLSDETDRFQAGVDDNLPVVQAQSSLAAARSQLVQSLYQYNQAKLGLARNMGVADSQYKVYLGK